MGGWIMAACVLAAILLGSLAVAQAQPGPSGPCARPEGLLTPEDRQVFADRILERMKERLGLSADQAQQLRALFQSRREQMRETVKRLCEAQIEFQGALRQTDATALRGAADRLKSAQGAMLDQRVEASLAVKGVLTAEQWTKWQEMRRHWGGRGRGQRPGV
jgi:Spy/CpxP family protein refolding chaperone